MTANQTFNPSELRIPADMIDPTLANKPNSGSADAAPANRELVGRRGSAPIEKSRAADEYLVSGRSPAPLCKRFHAVRTGTVESLIAADDRQRVLDTDLTPWRMICALHMRSAAGVEATATGWLAGPRTIITAGHHVHNRDFFDGWADSIEVSAGRNRSALPFSQFTATHFAACDRWVESADPDFDIGCIQLDLPLGDLTGWFGLASPAPSELETALVNVGGYPADRGDGTEQYFHANRVLHVGDRRIYYDIDTFGSQSGAPVWIHRTPSAPPVVIALQANGTVGGPFDLGSTANSTPRITPEIFDMINTWIHEDISVAA